MLEAVLHVCHDCGHPMHIQHQSDGQGGYITLLTCWEPSCLLNAVTLSADRYIHLTEIELKAYRKMNRISRVKYLGTYDNQSDNPVHQPKFKLLKG